MNLINFVLNTINGKIFCLQLLWYYSQIMIFFGESEVLLRICFRFYSEFDRKDEIIDWYT